MGDIERMVKRYMMFAFPGWKIVDHTELGACIEKPILTQTSKGVIAVGKVEKGVLEEHEAAWEVFASAIFNAVKNDAINMAEFAQALKGIYRMGMMPNVEICRSCGRPQMLAWRTDDKTWEQVVDGRYEILCVECFYELARASGIGEPQIDVMGIAYP